MSLQQDNHPTFPRIARLLGTRGKELMDGPFDRCTMLSWCIELRDELNQFIHRIAMRIDECDDPDDWLFGDKIPLDILPERYAGGDGCKMDNKRRL